MVYPLTSHTNYTDQGTPRILERYPQVFCCVGLHDSSQVSFKRLHDALRSKENGQPLNLSLVGV